MHTSMTTPAKRQQVFKDMVSVFLGGCCAFAVNVVDVKVVFAAAVLAGVLVTLQGGISVSAEVVVIFCFFGVLLQAIFVRRKPFMDFANFCFALALRATMLGAGLVFKVVSTLGTHQNRTNWRKPRSKPQLSEMLNVPFGTIGITTGWAHFLVASCGFINRCALNTASVCKTNASLPMSRQSTRLAPLHAGGGFKGVCATIRAVKKSILAHGISNANLKQLHHNTGGE